MVVSQNGIPDPAPDYTEQINVISNDFKEQINVISNDLRDLSGKIDLLIELLNQEDVPDEIEGEPEVVSENTVPDPPEVNVYVSVSSNTISENTVSQNALITTPLSDYSLTDSLLLVIVFLLLFDNVLLFIFSKK